MLPKTAKIIISFSLSLLSIILYLTLKGKLRRSCMIAMLLSTAGDLFMVDSFGLGSISTYPGAAFFMLGHIVYGLGFMKAVKDGGDEFKNKGFVWGAGIVTAAAVLLGALAFTVPEQPQTLMFFLLLIYLAVLGFNLVCQFSHAYVRKGGRWLTAAGMILFLISDYLIFLNMLSVCPAYNDVVWATYIPAQLLVILFCKELRRPAED